MVEAFATKRKDQHKHVRPPRPGSTTYLDHLEPCSCGRLVVREREVGRELWMTDDGSIGECV